jgi:hypothetical protein
LSACAPTADVSLHRGEPPLRAKSGRLSVKAGAKAWVESTPLVVWYENVLEYRPNLLRHNQ